MRALETAPAASCPFLQATKDACSLSTSPPHSPKRLPEALHVVLCSHTHPAETRHVDFFQGSTQRKRRFDRGEISPPSTVGGMLSIKALNPLRSNISLCRQFVSLQVFVSPEDQPSTGTFHLVPSDRSLVSSQANDGSSDQFPPLSLTPHIQDAGGRTGPARLKGWIALSTRSRGEASLPLSQTRLPRALAKIEMECQ